MTTEFPKPALSRRSLLRFAGGGIAAAALGATAGCNRESGGTEGPDVDLSRTIELPEPTPGHAYPDPYVGPRVYDRKPFGDGSTTFKVVVRQDPTVTGDWNKNVFSAWLEERTGVKVEYQAVNTTGPDGGTDLSKINAMLAGGELPDAFLGIPLSQGQIALYGQQGLFQDLTDIVDSYAPMQRKMLEEKPTLRTGMTAPDGRRYQMAGVNECYHCNTARSKAFINTEYLDKIGGEMPVTLEDFRSLLKELKERNPSGKKDFLPFIGGNPTWDGMDVWFVNPFTYNPGEPWLRLNNGQVEFVPTLPEWRQGMAYMRSLFDDGTLTKQSFSITSTELTKLGDQGLIGVARCFYWGAFVSIEYQKDALWRQYEPIMPLQGPTGNRIASNNYQVTPQVSLLITNNCEHPEVLTQWGDYQLDLEAILRAYDRGGEQGEQWDYAEEGEKGIDGRQAVWKTVGASDTDETVGRGWNQLSLMYRSLDFRNGQVNDPENPTFEADLYEVSKQYEEFWQPQEQQLPPLIFEDSVAAQVADTATTIKNHVLTSYAQFATAGEDIHDDKVWDDYVATFDKMGLQQYLEQHQQAYEARPK